MKSVLSIFYAIKERAILVALALALAMGRASPCFFAWTMWPKSARKQKPAKINGGRQVRDEGAVGARLFAVLSRLSHAQRPSHDLKPHTGRPKTAAQGSEPIVGPC